MFGKRRPVFGYNEPQPNRYQEPQQRMRASFGGSRGQEVISRRLDRQDPVPTAEEKSAALDAIIQAVVHAQEIGIADWEINSAVRGYNVAVTRNAQGGNDNGRLLPEEQNRSHRQGDEAGPYPGGNGV